MTPSLSHKAGLQTLAQKNVIHMLNGCPIILNNTISDTHQPMRRMSDETPEWDLTTYENRLRTFDGVWQLKFITPTQMAKAGLYYMGTQDRVSCVYCSKEFDYWQRGVDPFVEHQRQSPHCTFFNETSGYDVCGLYGSAPSDVESNHKSKKVQDFLDNVGILQPLRAPIHKDYVTFDARLKTFDKCLKTLKQDIHILCEAGFFYIGDGTNDQMLCFYCSQGLKDWEDDDEPWTEHAKWSDSCSFVLLNKGKNFVDKACGVINNNPKFNQTELFKLFGEHDASVLENNMKVNSIKRKLDDQFEISDISQIKISADENLHVSQKRDPNTLPDSITCKICYEAEINIALIPCCHVLCLQCALTIDLCAECRQPLSRAMRIYLDKGLSSAVEPTARTTAEEQCSTTEEQCSATAEQCSSTQCLEEKLDPMLCKVCHKEEMAAAFIPCRHVYACVKCAAEMHECPVCTEDVCATIQVYL